MRGGVIDGGGLAVGVGWPADGAFGVTFGAFHAVVDAVVGDGAFECGACPDIVDGGGAEAVFVFEDVGADAVFVFELLCGAGVGADGGVDACGVAEPVAEGVDVVDGHDAEGDPAEAFLPGHPVGDGAHVDGGEDGVAEGVLVEE